MNKIVFMMSVSLDGYFETDGHSLAWQHISEELHAHFNEELGAAGAMLNGRVTYELMAKSWPRADEDPAAPKVVAEFARIWRDLPKVAYSRTLREAGWNTTIVREVVPAEVEALRGAAGGDLFIGGPDLLSTFQRLDLVDEYRIYVHPAVIGAGNPLFRPGTTLDLTLTGTRQFANGVVLLRYRPAQAE
ncbi:dihydrofolate reductase family protein [Dactylosporangium siamense]|uniref:Riboflavin biosynthesis protein RibD n=1 Tax=Dactylosporangium siamense TaxID=685454 RepID=A0A919PED8_9ACTN|nr:dihydrofolate reductase family protein [Dactylosporangium siamense]GIG41989.1 riboflavin biosynthesis protein RibD [Dactylosporangium siamense]